MARFFYYTKGTDCVYGVPQFLGPRNGLVACESEVFSREGVVGGATVPNFKTLALLDNVTSQPPKHVSSTIVEINVEG